MLPLVAVTAREPPPEDVALRTPVFETARPLPTTTPPNLVVVAFNNEYEPVVVIVAGEADRPVPAVRLVTDPEPPPPPPGEGPTVWASAAAAKPSPARSANVASKALMEIPYWKLAAKASPDVPVMQTSSFRTIVPTLQFIDWPGMSVNDPAFVAAEQLALFVASK